MRIIINLDTKNAAFRNNDDTLNTKEVNRSIIDRLVKIASNDGFQPYTYKIYDLNGNVSGKMRIKR